MEVKDAILASLEETKMVLSEAKIEKMIYLIRSERVIIDTDLAKLYQVEVGALNRQVKRNIDRFPSDFMFQLSKTEFAYLRKIDQNFASVTKARKYPPFVFTEYGIAALSGVLNSKIAIRVNTSIIRTFIKMRKILAADQSILNKVEQLEKGTDQLFKITFDRLELLETNTPSLLKKRRKIGIKK
ncbi:MAG: ORF6N domain-containing protein [Flavobacteriaceae bacterium]|nr:ORF6N domain-containing protein [Flavobacteriaceae bacterium]